MMIPVVLSTALCLLIHVIWVAGLTTHSCVAVDGSTIDVDAFKSTLLSGRAYHHPHFLSESQVLHFLNEIDQLEENFTRSGLSNTAAQAQAFGQQDRQLCPVPWWKTLLLDANNLSTDTTTPLHPAALRLNELRIEFANILDRPTMADPSLAHECYYSVSSPGSSLPRHMDERHEELKGAKGWLLPSRRSLSWLIYLSDEDWDLQDNGGALRTFPQQVVGSPNPPHHQGNLQVGWLSRKDEQHQQPVYLNSWFVPKGSQEPHNVLYTLNDDATVHFITHPWLAEQVQGMSVVDFLLDTENLFLVPQDNFYLLEDRRAWGATTHQVPPAGSEIVDIPPSRGSLVVFDSLLLPHQVERVHQGRRVALAGWFHETTQEIPLELLH